MESIVPVFTVVPQTPASKTHRQIKTPRVRLSVSQISSSTVIAVVGDVDAANAHDVAATVMTHLHNCTQLLLDLSELEFLAVQGYSWIRDINTTCVQRAIPWALVPSAEVSRVINLCDPGGTLPLAPTTSVGLDTMNHEPRRHLRLLPWRLSPNTNRDVASPR
jgi:anti-anti-sigma factor